MTCSYCDWWAKSPVVQKGRSFNTRKCIASDIKIQADSKTCKYFNPIFFFCDQAGQRLSFIQCIARRRNEKKINAWASCRKCRQFDKEIKAIVEKYFIDVRPIVTPMKFKNKTSSVITRKIKRRNKTERQIKRRNKGRVERQIKRREKPRKIKRRKKDRK